jgi:hypothetical protein
MPPRDTEEAVISPTETKSRAVSLGGENPRLWDRSSPSMRLLRALALLRARARPAKMKTNP